MGQSLRRGQWARSRDYATAAAPEEPKHVVNEATIIQSTQSGEETNVSNTGFILRQKDRTTLFIDHICIPKESKWDWKQYITPLVFPVKDDAVIEYVKTLTSGYDDVDIVPVPRDGGAFVTMKLPAATTPQLYNKSVIYNISQKSQLAHRFLLRPGIYPVKGIPWVEDLGRYPSKSLKIKFQGDILSQELLYAMFRRYGKIADIALPKPGDAEQTAIITYWTLRSAISARHCLTGVDVGGTVLHIHYKRRVSENMLIVFVRDHSRIAIPLILGLIAAIAVLVFDPIRSWFIKEKIKGEFDWNRNQYWRGIWQSYVTTRNKVKGLLNMSGTGNEEWELWSDIEDLMEERKNISREVKLWLEENVNSMIVIQGPAGSGKRNLVNNMILEDRENVLYVDCENIIKSRKDYQIIQNMAHELGYFPVFSFMTSISSFLDLFVKSLTGQNAGLSESKEVQIQGMLTLSLVSIRELALANYYKMKATTEDYHVKEEDYLQQNPKAKPVIVIDRFQAARKKNQANSFIYKQLAEWASSLVQLNIAHVVFITDDVGALQELISSLPTSPLKRVVLSDASPSASQLYVKNALRLSPDGQSTDDSITISPEMTADLDKYSLKLGGRMRDLQMFVRRIKSGDTPEQALEGLTEQAVEQLSQVFLTSKDDYGFNMSQAWQIIKLLAVNPSIPYEQIFLLPMFKKDTVKILQNMENVELIRLRRHEGVVTDIVPAKPLFSTAFQRMVEDRQIYRVMEKECLLGMIEFEANRIKKFLEELRGFKEVPEPKLFSQRLKYLSNKIETGSKFITECETAMGKLK